MKIPGTELKWQDLLQGAGMVAMMTGTAVSAMFFVIPRIAPTPMSAEQIGQILFAIKILVPVALVGGVCAIAGTILVTMRDRKRDEETRKREIEEDRRFRELFRKKDYEGLEQLWEEKAKRMRKS